MKFCNFSKKTWSNVHLQVFFFQARKEFERFYSDGRVGICSSTLLCPDTRSPWDWLGRLKLCYGTTIVTSPHIRKNYNLSRRCKYHYFYTGPYINFCNSNYKLSQKVVNSWHWICFGFFSTKGSSYRHKQVNLYLGWKFYTQFFTIFKNCQSMVRWKILTSKL